MNNIFDLFKIIKNPEQYVREYAKQNPSPMMDNLIKMAEQRNQQGVENVARNVFKEKGEDFDRIVSNLR